MREHILSSIQYYRRENDYCYEKLGQLEEKCKNLDVLKVRMHQFQDQFGEIQNHRRKSLEKISSIKNKARAVESYKSSMQSLLNGREFSGAYSGLDDAGQRVVREIEVTEEEMRQLRQQICNNESQISYLYRELAALEEE